MSTDFDLDEILAEFSGTEGEDLNYLSIEDDISEITPKTEPGIDDETKQFSQTAVPKQNDEQEAVYETDVPVLTGIPEELIENSGDELPAEDDRSKENADQKSEKKDKKKAKKKSAISEKTPVTQTRTADKESRNVADRRKEHRKEKKESAGARLGHVLLSLVFMLLSLAALTWSIQNLHPDTGASGDGTKSLNSTNLVNRLDASLNNSKANALSDITYIPKHYSIPETDTVAPKPSEANYGKVTPDNAAEIVNIIEQARDSGLLEGQEMIFRPDLNFRSDTYISYYYDETILTIIWKEIIEGNTVTCCETKVADPSQFRRKIVDDTFGSGNQLYATSIAASVNAVVAMNADFYMFRDFGIVVYNRELYRFSDAVYTGSYKKYNCTDTLFVTGEGDFIFWHRLQEATESEMREFIRQNNIVFSIAFGPILVENGELTPCDWYPAGEIDRGYSRAGIGQKDHLHYFYMSLNHSAEMEARWNVNKFGQKMYERGLQQAYCLDGGQTSEIVWRGEPYNYIDFGAERLVSDIIYFATAIPETEAGA